MFSRGKRRIHIQVVKKRWRDEKQRQDETKEKKDVCAYTSCWEKTKEKKEMIYKLETILNNLEPPGAKRHRISKFWLFQLISFLILKIQKTFRYRSCRKNCFLSICVFRFRISHRVTFPREFCWDLLCTVPFSP